MPFCPNCKTEYKNEYKTCNDCGSELVEKLPESEKFDFNEAVFLTSVGDEIQADMLEEELESNGIPVLKKYKEAGAVMEIYMGMTRYGIDLYVPSKQINEAKEVLKDFSCQETFTDDDKELLEENKQYIKKRAIRAWFILLFVVPGVVFAVTYIIMASR